MDSLLHQRRPISRDLIYGCLQECIRTKNLAAGRQAHSVIVSASLESVPVLRDFLIQLYASGGSLAEAKSVFCRTSEPSTHTWHAIISAHVKLGESKRAFALYQEMLKQGIVPNRFIFLCVLKACCNVDSFEQGLLVHMHIIQFGMDLDVIVSTTLVDMYTKCGKLEEAHKVFVQSPHSDAVLWGALISGYVRQGQDLIALELFKDMQDKGRNPDRFVYSCILKAC
eukprot:c11912_g1_i1 orf=276-953(+)